jgi:putative DNA methylase
VVQSLKDGELRFNRYQLHSYVVMPNHVHLLVTPKVDAAKWLRSLKGFTGHEGNRLLGLAGQPFWQGESYDHLVRSADEFSRIRLYIENNPVKAGLVPEATDFPWSSGAGIHAGSRL